ncbi:GIY-YIG catalytic domain containing protein [Brugia malayi]|uniref:Structure-specific endonuclease subunit SLX1 homolog n=3 Tax=Brugia TaxID=6278 RepID=SLX1_BRUMA|nr:GIY-YIG catalytic domain containing protein [Brugia malayi]A8PV03.1 RecName: Full=Structure-specific endonuclease subunit SLX1 homolog [Brugia malayi]CRZ24603.1 BMA-SLX-1 [Brugia malayi]VIO85818.1 GIY-YIG catalytic domain containing protein [Brugia malayi]
MSADESNIICIEDDEENIEESGVKYSDKLPVCQGSSKILCRSSSQEVIQENERKKRGKNYAVPSILDDFFGVYCLLSRSPNRYFKNRCYIGYTVNPNRRIRQHNAGKEFGGAKKTDHRGPWDMVCIIHGFPNSVSALRFEWAWQNPEKSRRLRLLNLKKRTSETAFGFRLRIACHMLNSDPWRRLSLTFRWLLPELEIPFPLDVLPPSHIAVEHGAVTKISTLIPQLQEEYDVAGTCSLCLKPILSISELLRCHANETCKSHFHMRCLSKHALNAVDEYRTSLFPIQGQCPKCGVVYLWGDLIRDQRILLAVNKFNSSSTLFNMIPRGKLIKM